jgi:hypothetical protein
MHITYETIVETMRNPEHPRRKPKTFTSLDVTVHLDVPRDELFLACSLLNSQTITVKCARRSLDGEKGSLRIETYSAYSERRCLDEITAPLERFLELFAAKHRVPETTK